MNEFSSNYKMHSVLNLISGALNTFTHEMVVQSVSGWDEYNLGKVHVSRDYTTASPEPDFLFKTGSDKWARLGMPFLRLAAADIDKAEFGKDGEIILTVREKIYKFRRINE